jgi:glutathione S-transferase
VADVVLGLSINRWLMTPIERAVLPAVEAYVARLRERPAYLEFGANGLP